MKAALFPPPPLLDGRAIRRKVFPPSPADYDNYQQILEQGFRIADNSLDVFVLFVGEGEVPDFSAAPTATSPSLPFEWQPTPPAAGTLDLHLVVRKKNQYELESFNVWVSIITIDSNGEEVLGPITAPTDIKIKDVEEGSVRVSAWYKDEADRNPADTWKVWAAEGMDPVPGVDAPVYSGAMVLRLGRKFINQEISGFTPGADLHVVVAAYRAADDEWEAAAVILHPLPLYPTLEESQAQTF